MIEQAKNALSDAFERLNVSFGSKGLCRHDYDILMQCTDGESCDDDTWKYLIGNVVFYACLLYVDCLLFD